MVVESYWTGNLADWVTAWAVDVRPHALPKVVSRRQIVLDRHLHSISPERSGYRDSNRPQTGLNAGQPTLTVGPG